MRLKQISKRSLAILLTVLMVFSTLMVGTITTANAAVNHTGGYIYFDNTNTGWTDNYIYLCIGKGTSGNSSYTSLYQMTKVANTNLYRYSLPKWDGATYFAVIGNASSWGDGTWGTDNLKNATHYTAAYTANYQFKSGSYYMLTPSANSNGTSLTPTAGTAVSFLNSTSKATAQLKDDSGAYNDSTAAGTVSVSGYYMSNYSTCSTRSAVSSTSTASTTLARTSTATLKATPNAGYKFDGWYDGSSIVSTETTYTYTVTSTAKTHYARFSKSSSTVTVGQSTNGSITVNGKGAGQTVSVNAGSAVTLTNTPDAGYKFDNYATTSGTVIKGNSYTVNSNVTIFGEFSKQTYNITDNSTNGSVTVTGGSSASTYQIGQTLTFTATPVAGYSSNGKVTVNGVEHNSPYTVTVDSTLINGITTSATFTANNYTITYNKETGIDLTVPTSAKYNENVTVTINSITPGYECKFIYVDGTQYAVSGTTVTFKMPAKNVTITTDTAVKALQTPAVKINGSNTVNGVGDTYTTTLTPVVTPATGDAAEVDYSKGQFTVNSDKAHVELVNDGVFTEYKFYADEPGTYTVTYTGVIVSTVDGKTTKTGTNTLTITVSYSATQQAYKDLESVFEAKGHEIASNYDTSSDYWKDYETAISTATGLLTGMPTADDDEKVAAYNAAATALETAYEGLANCSNESTVYILTQKSSNVKIYAWDGNNCDLPDEQGQLMTLVANYNNSRYLWKTTFKGTCNFSIYSSTATAPSTTNKTKLTGTIEATEAGKTYFIDREDVTYSEAKDYETSYEMLALTGNGISVNSSVKMMQGTAFTLKDAFPVSVKSSVYSANPSLYTVTYYIDGEKVTGTTWKTEVQGQHSVYAVITGGTSNGATYETVTTQTINFEVEEDLTTTWTYVGYSDSNKTIESGYNHVPMLKGTMNGVAFAYYENLDRTGYNKFFLVANNKSVYNYNSSIYVKDSLSSYATDIPIYDHDGKVAKADTGNPHYIVVFYPNTNYGTWNGVTINNTSSSPKVVCYEDLPGDGYTDKYRVVIENGSGNQVDSNNARGESYLDGDTSKVSIKKDVTDLTIQMSTDIKSMTNYLGDFTGYAQKVYGYSILMEMRDGSTQVASVSGNAISSPAVGKYTASYTFPENIKSAKITPIFVSSDEFATARGLTFTTVYLKLTPGDNLYENTYEPKYYTWRTNDESVNVVSIDGKSYAGRPEGVYPGQKMLYVGSDMYMAIVETKIKGILFNDGHSGVTQTFDYNEFIKLQDLGYNNITFEPKKNTQETVASSMNSSYAGSGLKVYSSTSNSPTTITSALTKAEFQLDVNIEGYYIDVFGNKLVDTEGNPVLQSALREEMTAKGTEINTSTEITALLNKMGKDLTTDAGRRTLYGARYGWYTEEGFYGMTYGIRVYYFNHLNKMVSQQVSGYGTIEGAQSPNNNQLTNAAYAKNNNILLQHAQGNKPAASVAQTFTTGYELIPEDYKNVPYLVSYKIKTNSRATVSEHLQTDHYRIDGKWYYQAATPQITVNMKTGLMDENDNLVMTNGVITDQGTTYGTGTINNATTITVDQGTQAAINANPITGYKFVGFYDKTGKLISTQNPDTFTCAIGTDIYAVFQKLGEGTLTVTNGVYRGTNPKDGEGNGIVGVELTIFNADGSVKETLKGVNSVTANITEGEGYQWKLTGKPTGVDKFIAFRQPEEQVDGTYYYSKLDVEEYLSNDSNGMWTYAPYAVTEFDWDDYDTKSLSFNFVTDFQKVSVYARLNYHYRNRFNEPRTYTVNNVLLDDDEIANNFTPSKDKIKKYAPPIDEVFTDCEWNVDGTGVLESGDSVANLTAIQTKKQFNTYVYDEEKSVNAERIPAYYDTVIELNAADKDNFKYWKQYEIDSTGKKVGDGVIFSYDPTVSIRVSFNRYFEAVYDDVEVQDVVTSVQDPLYTREKYTAEDGTVKDYIYVDFLLQFETCLDDSFKDFVKYSDYRVKYGIILERDTTVQYTAKDAEAGTKPADKAPTYDNRTYENVEAVVEKLGYNVADGGSTGGWTTETNTSDPEYNYYYNLFDLTNYAGSLTSLGRIDYFLMFDNNVEVNRNHVYNVYSYVIYDTTIINDNGESEKVTKVVISTPKVMNIREIGDRTDGTN